MKKALILLLCFGLLTSCANFASFNQAPPAVQKSSLPVKKASYNRHQTSANSNNANISLNDFSNLNLSNYETSSGNLWQKIADGLQIPEYENRPEVQQQIRWFMAHPAYLQRTTERARPYLYIVYKEVKDRGLPTELVLLPINESAYYPFSSSNRGATGIWQLMPGAASDWGLKRDFWYDGRRDIFDSTNAALDYLTYLAHYFNGDWLLAIAAYDTGEGNVEHAISRNLREGQPTDFWSLHLASETEAYVPRLLALATILHHPDRYPLPLPPVDDKPVIAPVHLQKQIKLTDAAKLAGISVNQLKVLNPGLSHTATDPSADSKLLLPIDSIENFKTNLNNFAAPEISQPQNFGHYRVQRGETLQNIADRFGISVDDLRSANSILGRHVPTGRVLLIPNVAENFKPSTQINLDQTPLSLNSSSDTVAAPAPTKPKVTASDDDSNNTPPSKTVTSSMPPKHVIKHKVLPGETLVSISHKYHVSLPQLIKLNPGINNQHLRPGMVIVIESTNQPLATAPVSKHTKNVHHSKHPPAKTKKNVVYS